MMQRKKIIFGVSTFTAVVDGIAYGVLSFAEILTSAQNFITINPASLARISCWLPLSIVPFFAGTGDSLVDIHENHQAIFSESKPTEIFKSINQVIKENPASLFIIVVGGVVEGIVFFTNLGYSVNQFGMPYEASSLFYPGVTTAIIISGQFMVVYGKQLVDYVRKGFALYDYTHALENKLLRYALMGCVNVPPIIGSSIIGFFGVSETYQLAQALINLVTPTDIANTLAWAPAFGLGITYGFFDYLIYGIPFKQALAYLVTRIRFGAPQLGNQNSPSEQNGNSEQNQTQIANSTQANHWRKRLTKASAFSMIILLSSSAIIIGFGTLDEIGYTFAFGEPPPNALDPDSHLEEYQQLFPLWQKLTIFSVPILTLGAQRFVGQGFRLLQLATGEKPIYKRKLVFQGNIKAVKEKNKSQYYSLPKIGSDVLMISLTGGVKLLLDWAYIPDDVMASDLSFRQVFISSLFLGLAGLGIRLFQNWVFPNNDLVKAISLNNLRKYPVINEEDEPLLYFHQHYKGYTLHLKYQDVPNNSEIQFNKIYLYQDNNSIRYAVRKNSQEVQRGTVQPHELGNLYGVIQTVLNDNSRRAKLAKPQEKDLFSVLANKGFAQENEEGTALRLRRASRKQIWLAYLIQYGLIATGTALGTYYLLQYLLADTEDGEQEVSLATNQFVSTLASSVAAAASCRSWGSALRVCDAVKAKVHSATRSLYSFFSHRNRESNLLVQHENERSLNNIAEQHLTRLIPNNNSQT